MFLLLMLLTLFTVFVGGPGLLFSITCAVSYCSPDGASMAHWAFIVGFTPLGLAIWRARARMARRAQEHAGMLSSAGMRRGEGFDHWQGSTGIAIDPRARIVHVRVGPKTKAYPYADIREWQVVRERGGRVVGSGGLGATFVAGSANFDAAREAAAASGLFLTVRDIEHPKWRVEMSDPQQQARWMEILRQELNEGGAARHAHA